jgi:hypothetical protein
LVPEPTIDLDPFTEVIPHGLENLLSQQLHGRYFLLIWGVVYVITQGGLTLGHFFQSEVLGQVHFFLSKMSSSCILFSLEPADDPK